MLQSIAQRRLGVGQRVHERDVEIVTYVAQGELEHQDSIGRRAHINEGDAQRVSAGVGLWHAEAAASPEGVTEVVEMRIEPALEDIVPDYEQRDFSALDRRGQLLLVASPDGRHGSLSVNQDVFVYAGLFDGAERAALAIAAGRCGYVHVVRGALSVQGARMAKAEGRKVDPGTLVLERGEDAEVLVLDLGAPGG